MRGFMVGGRICSPGSRAVLTGKTTGEDGGFRKARKSAPRDHSNQGAGMRARILLADHQRILTDGLSKLLEPYYEVVATAANGYELVSLGKELCPDVIVTEISMPLLNGMDALRLLKKSGARSKFVVLTMHLDMGLAVQAFPTGASAYVLKLASTEEIHAAVEAALHGRYYLSSTFPADLVTVLAEAARHPAQAEARLAPPP